MNRIIIIGILLFLNIVGSNIVLAQSAKSYKEILSENRNDKFPKVLIYDAPQLPISYKDYIKLGFDYLSVYSLTDAKTVPNSYKYLLWTGIASNDAKAKWSTERSPFVDDINQYTKRWNNRLNHYKKKYYNSNDRSNLGLMILDIEAKRSNEELEKEPPFRNRGTKNKERAIAEYKTEMEKLYRYPLEFAKTKHNYYEKWSSYSDVPIERNWWGIPNRTWQAWTTDPQILNYVTHKSKNGKPIETDFANQLDFYAVGPYFFYNPEFSNPNTANQYLAYLLFQLEVNQVWTNKPIYLYFNFKYQGTKERGTLIDKNMVKSSVIFSFMSGADGMVLYDDSRKATNNPNYHALIKTFVESISSLDEYRDYFVDKDVVFYKPDNARDLFTERKPVIRGIEKNGKLLLAATNPFAKENEITRIPVYYKGKYISIQIKGKETYFNEIEL